MAVAAVALVLNKCMKNGETCYAFHIKFPYYSPTCPTTTVFCTTSNSENEGWLRRKQREMAFPIYEALLHLIFFSFLVIKIFDGIFHARFFSTFWKVPLFKIECNSNASIGLGTKSKNGTLKNALYLLLLWSFSNCCLAMCTQSDLVIIYGNSRSFSPDLFPKHGH